MKMSIPYLSLAGALIIASGVSAQQATRSTDPVIQAQAQPIAGLPNPSIDAYSALKSMFKNHPSLKLDVWDDKRALMVASHFAAAKVSASDPDFIQIRESLATEAVLSARTKIISAFLTKASASNIMSVPGNPIEKQLKALGDEERRAREIANRMRAQAQKEASELIAATDQALADELQGATAVDRINSLLDAVIKKIDATYDPAKIGSDKKKRIEDLKLRRDKAEENLRVADEKKLELDKAAEKARDMITRSMSSDIETYSKMPLFGAVAIQQVESFDELRDQLKIAVAVIWSTKTELEARNMLMNKGKGEPRPGAGTFEEWKAKQNLAVMVGPRRFLSEDGTVYFIGISAIEYDPDDPGTHADLVDEAGEWAKQAALLSMFGDTESYKMATQLRQSIKDGGNPTKERVFKSFQKELSQQFTDLNISGLMVDAPIQMVHPASGRPVFVVMAYVNSALAAKAPDLMKDTYATLRELNADQAFRSGQIEGMKAAAQETKNSAAERAKGQLQGASSVRAEAASRVQAELAPPRSQLGSGSASSAGGASKGKAQSGVWAGNVQVQDDF